MLRFIEPRKKELNMEYLFYASFVLPIVAIVICYFIGSDKLDAGIVFIPFVAFIPVFFMSCAIGENYTNTARYMAIIDKQEPIIQHYEKYIKRLDVKIQKAGSQGQAMFTSTHDTPVKAMVEGQLVAENKMLDAMKARDEAKIKVEAIRLGLMGFVVKWVQEKRSKK
jgi:hypothetical protein